MSLKKRNPSYRRPDDASSPSSSSLLLFTRWVQCNSIAKEKKNRERKRERKRERERERERKEWKRKKSHETKESNKHWAPSVNLLPIMQLSKMTLLSLAVYLWLFSSPQRARRSEWVSGHLHQANKEKRFIVALEQSVPCATGHLDTRNKERVFLFLSFSFSLSP